MKRQAGNTEVRNQLAERCPQVPSLSTAAITQDAHFATLCIMEQKPTRTQKLLHSCPVSGQQNQRLYKPKRSEPGMIFPSGLMKAWPDNSLGIRSQHSRKQIGRRPRKAEAEAGLEAPNPAQHPSCSSWHYGAATCKARLPTSAPPATHSQHFCLCWAQGKTWQKEHAKKWHKTKQTSYKNIKIKAKKFRLLQFSSSHTGFPIRLLKQGSAKKAQRMGSNSKKAPLVRITAYQMVRKIWNWKFAYSNKIAW